MRLSSAPIAVTAPLSGRYVGCGLPVSSPRGASGSAVGVMPFAGQSLELPLASARSKAMSPDFRGHGGLEQRPHGPPPTALSRSGHSGAWSLQLPVGRLSRAGSVVGVGSSSPYSVGTLAGSLSGGSSQRLVSLNNVCVEGCASATRPVDTSSTQQNRVIRSYDGSYGGSLTQSVRRLACSASDRPSWTQGSDGLAHAAYLRGMSPLSLCKALGSSDLNGSRQLVGRGVLQLQAGSQRDSRSSPRGSSLQRQQLSLHGHSGACMDDVVTSCQVPGGRSSVFAVTLQSQNVAGCVGDGIRGNSSLAATAGVAAPTTPSRSALNLNPGGHSGVVSALRSLDRVDVDRLGSCCNAGPIPDRDFVERRRAPFTYPGRAVHEKPVDVDLAPPLPSQRQHQQLQHLHQQLRQGQLVKPQPQQHRQRDQGHGTLVPKPHVELTPGAIVEIGNVMFQIGEAIGEGTFGFVWGARNLQDDTLVAIKDIFCRSPSAIEEGLTEGYMLEDLQGLDSSMASSQGVSRQVPSLVTSDVSDAWSPGPALEPSQGYRVRLVMTQIPGESLNRFLDRRKAELATVATAYERGPSEACRYARQLLAQLAPAFCKISALAYHRDVNPRNILLDEKPGDAAPSYGLVDFGLAVNAESWRSGRVNSSVDEAAYGTWQCCGVGGDCRYWPVSAWLMLEQGPKALAAHPQLCTEYKTHLDVQGLGMTALQVLVDMLPSSPPPASSCLFEAAAWQSLWNLRETWIRYWSDVTHLWRRLYEAYRQSGDGIDLSIVKEEYRQIAVHEKIRDALYDLRVALRNACDSFNRLRSVALQQAMPNQVDCRMRLWEDGLPLLNALLEMVSSGEASARASWRRVVSLVQDASVVSGDGGRPSLDAVAASTPPRDFEVVVQTSGVSVPLTASAGVVRCRSSAGSPAIAASLPRGPQRLPEQSVQTSHSSESCMAFGTATSHPLPPAALLGTEAVSLRGSASMGAVSSASARRSPWPVALSARVVIAGSLSSATLNVGQNPDDRRSVLLTTARAGSFSPLTNGSARGGLAGFPSKSG